MAKLSLINREKKREALVAKYAAKRADLNKIIQDQSKSEDERYEARLKLQQLPRNANPTRLRNRCQLTGRPRGTFRQFGLGRTKLRDAAMSGGVFQNRKLLEFIYRTWHIGNLYMNEAVPSNDGGLALGQLWLGNQL